MQPEARSKWCGRSSGKNSKWV